jgi:hypothetical protein
VRGEQMVLLLMGSESGSINKRGVRLCGGATGADVRFSLIAFRRCRIKKRELQNLYQPSNRLNLGTDVCITILRTVKIHLNHNRNAGLSTLFVISLCQQDRNHHHIITNKNCFPE